jgi:SIR2-like domain
LAKADKAHFQMVANALADGTVVVFLGAGVNWCDRPAETDFEVGTYLPDGKELSKDLVRKFGYPREDTEELARVAQYVALMAGEAPLYERLREIFSPTYTPTSLHNLFADLPKSLKANGRFTRCPLIVTTNYDNVLEQAFSDAGEPLDIVVYAPRADREGLFEHIQNGSEPRVIGPDELGFALEERTVLLKIHGVVAENTGCVITEDDYIEYLAMGDVLKEMPVKLAERLRNSNFLFLGYGMADWNIRALLRRIHEQQVRGWASWAVQLKPDTFDERLWQTRNVFIFDVPIDSYVSNLGAAIGLRPRS